MTKFSYLLLLSLLIISCKNDPTDDPEIVEKEVPKMIEEFGFKLNDFEVIRDTIQSGETFGFLMDKQGVSAAKVFSIVNKVKDIIDVARLRAGRPYTVLKSKDTTNTPQVFIYQPSRIDYVVIHLGDSIYSYRGKLPISTKRRMASGVITSSLSQSMVDEGLSQILVHELSSVYQWTVDFFKLQKGDNFKIIYNENYINDTIYAGIESVEATLLNHYGKPYYGFRFMTDSVQGVSDYYDEKANTLRSFFLKAPLNYSRISSRFSPSRLHPVTRQRRPHLGTDYAAPHGTPIVSTANGIVERSGYTGGNGNYVKVKHNNTYSTQYLHMSKRAVKKGDRVKQGDVIGYVGSTGLATGPHVCYRFWYNGKQVDPYAINLPAAEPIKEEFKEDYFKFIKPLKAEIDAIPEKTIPL
ncbi:MAG: peptidoglycan DD-metalloendopeptidase family protein [Flavobacteriaceae bacterium]|nr:peptidoglycan DD-metalloendopeptidase family protein [Flavobacteriaceae bacterium]